MRTGRKNRKKNRKSRGYIVPMCLALSGTLMAGTATAADPKSTPTPITCLGKITEYQNRLKELEAQRTEQENFEIVNLVRSMCMSRDELMNFLRGGGNDAPPVETAYHEQEDMTDDEE